MERKKRYRQCLIFAFFITIGALGTFHYREEQKKIPDSYVQTEGGAVPNYSGFWVTEEIVSDLTEASTGAKKAKEYIISYKYLGLIPIKEAQVKVLEPTYVFPGGIPVGIYLETEGILVVGTGKVTGRDGLYYEPADRILQKGDYILAVNRQPVMEKEDLIELIQRCAGEELILDLKRKGEAIQVKLEAVQTAEGDYKLGVWVRDNTQGVGTLTFLTEGGQFGALGHGISDVDTGTLLELSEGKLYDTNIVAVKKSEKGTPGELSGLIRYQANLEYGELQKNTAFGIFGNTFDRLYQAIRREKVQIGYKQEIELGKAWIRSAVSGTLKDYEVEIVEIQCKETDLNKGIVLKVTDPELLELTGGIVQGMSGSPILQNGRIVGAVTHVLINDPTRGYGIFIENMLEAAENGVN